MQLSLTTKQKLGLKMLDDPTVTDILWGGGAGSGKTLIACIWMILQCRNYPGITIGLGRKELTRLKQTTIISLLQEAHPLLGIGKGEYRYNEHGGRIEYINGSSIQLIDLSRQPSDPNYDRYGSLLLTHVVIEEAGEIQRRARDVFISRKNRFRNREYNLVGKSITTCNPSSNFLKLDYYNEYLKLGGGDYQKWPHGQVEIDGKMTTAYRAFIRSLAYDNPFLPRNYIESLKQLPLMERKRLLEGNWDFENVDTMIFPPHNLDRALTEELKTGQRYLGVDIADTGGDKTVITLFEEDTFVEQKEVVVDKTKAIGEQITQEIIKYAQLNNIQPKQIAIDGIGVGASCRDFLRSRGWYVQVFIAGAGSTENYRNLRSEVIWKMGQAFDKGEIKIYKGLLTMDKLREQLMAHEYETQERIIVVKPKQDIKEVLGVSPDYAESAYIAYWVAKGNTDPKQNINRIIY